MKKFAFLLVCFALCFTAISQNNKLTITSVNGLNVDTVLKRYLEGPGVKITDGQFNMNTGNISSQDIGRFTKQANANFPFQKGLYMKTSTSSYYDGNNNFTSINLKDLLPPTQDLGKKPSDPEIDKGGGAALDFNFVAYADTFSFKYIFSSSEYTSYTCSNYNDVFAFILEGWDPVTFTETAKNVAIVPTTITASNPVGLPVSINTINNGCSGSNSAGPGQYDGTYSAYFTLSYNSAYPSNFVEGTSLNGSTVALTAESKIVSCQSYKMHLAISNVNDKSYQSAVFLEEGSFYSPTVEISQEYSNNVAGGDTLIQHCRECDLTFTLPMPSSTTIPVSVSVGGTAMLNQDFELAMPDGTLLNPTNNNFVIPADVTQESLHMKILPDAQFSSGEVKVVNVYFITQPCQFFQESRSYDTLTFYLRGNDSIKLEKGIVLGACDTLKQITVGLENGNPANYSWTPSAGILQPDVLSPRTSITQSGIYKLVASDPWNCMKDSTEVTVTIVEKPNFTVSYNPTRGCVPLNVILQTQYTPDYATPSWTVFQDLEDGTGFSLESGENLFNASLSDTGYYNVKLLLTSAPGCADSVLLRNVIHVSDYPVADFIFTPSGPGNGEVITFTNTSTGNNLTNFVWNFGDGHSSHLENPEHAYHLQESDIKTTVLTVTNADGCSDDVYYSIPIEDKFAIFVPSGFTPNQDGKNEVFLPKVNDVTNYRLEIFSRNGEMIFSTTDPKQSWDGKFKGKIVAEGVYIYKIHYSRIGTPDIKLIKTGTITILR